MIQYSTNFLSPIGFQLGITILPNVGFYAQQCNIPGITLPNATQVTRFSDVPVAGDKITWENFNITFMIDAEMNNFLAIWNWMQALAPATDSRDYDYANQKNSPGVLQILGGDNAPIRTIYFEDLIPTSLNTLQFSSTESDVSYLQGSAEFMYSSYRIE